MYYRDFSFNLVLSELSEKLSEIETDKDKKEELKKVSEKHFDNYKKENNKSEPVIN